MLESMGTCLNVPIDVFRVQQVIVELHLINTVGGKGMRFNISETTTKNFHFCKPYVKYVIPYVKYEIM